MRADLLTKKKKNKKNKKNKNYNSSSTFQSSIVPSKIKKVPYFLYQETKNKKTSC